MKCKNLKIRTEKGIKYGYCKLKDCKVDIFCSKCSFEVKYRNSNQIKKESKIKVKPIKTYKPMKKRSNKLAKAEKNRFSIIYQDMKKCAACGQLAIEINEVFEGAYRQASIRYGMCMPMCYDCHRRFHEDREFALYYKRMFQDKFVEEHSLEEFIKIFCKDYHYSS